MRTRRTPKKAQAAQLAKEATDRAARQETFLSVLRNSANVRAACHAAGISRSAVYEWRDTNPVFHAAWETALAEACDTLEATAWMRARGVERTQPLYYKGKQIGEETSTDYSDTLLIFLLKAHRPAMYRETIRQEHTGKDGGPIATHAGDVAHLTDAELDALIGQLRGRVDAGD